MVQTASLITATISTTSFQNVLQVSPLMILLLTGLALMMMDAFKMRKVLPWVAAIGTIASMVVAVPAVLDGIVTSFGYAGREDFAFAYMMRTNEMSSIVHIFLCASGLFTLFFVGDFLKRTQKPVHEIYAILIFCIVGMSMMANANDLIITFIGLETMSICLYIMAALFKTELRSNEAGLKYFLLGAFATGFLVFGISLLYGAAGSTTFYMPSDAGLDGRAAMDFGRLVASPLFYPGVGLFLIGFLFKISAFPFHMWTPDVYSGAPTPLAGFMATGSKAAAFIALTSFLSVSPIIYNDSKLMTVILICAVLTMLYGNIVAAQQSNLKRMLAYSSIAHSGYVMLAVAAGPQFGGPGAVIFYMFIYTIMNIGAFGMISMIETSYEDVDMENWAGIGRKIPWFGAIMALFLFSLAGIPPLAGFMGKYFVFLSALNAGLVGWAIIGILTSVVGAYYYIKVIQKMYFGKTEGEEEVTQLSPSTQLAPVAGVIILAALLVIFGVYPSLIM